MKLLTWKWLVKTFQHIADNLLFIVNGFVKAGICQALDVENEALAVDGVNSDSFSDMEDSEIEEVDVNSD